MKPKIETKYVYFSIELTEIEVDDLTVRLTGIKLKNFKNVKYGELDRESSVFIPVAKYECLIGKDKEEMMDLLVAKRMAYTTSRSSVF